MIRVLIPIVALLFASIPSGFACTMYKITKNGKTLIGNNEDFITPNTQIWIEKGTEAHYSVMYVGFMDIPQGAINEAGLVVDGFATSWLPVENTEGKTKMSLDTALVTVMQTMATVEEVKAYYEQLDLSEMARYQLVFIDKSGTYLIIEGDEMIIGDEDEKTFSNFRYSKSSSLDGIQLPYYQKGLSFLGETQGQTTFDYCGNVMENMAQTDLTATQYSTLYDLGEMKIRLYYHHDYDHFVEFDLVKEFEKENYKMNMADLFPDTSEGKQFYLKYNNPEKPYWIVENAIGTATYTEEQLTNAGIGFVVTMLGKEWRNSMKNPEAAIKVYAYGIGLMPNNIDLYNGLGEIYFEMENFADAKIHFEKSLNLDQGNEKAKEFLQRIEQIAKR